MSQATKTAIVSLLLADTELDALLARDPNDEDALAPALFNSNKNDAPPAYDCITFREASRKPVRQFVPTVPGSGPTPVTEELWDFEAWTQTPDSGPVEALLGRLRANLENVALDLPGGGRIHKAEVVLEQPDLYDDKLNARYGLLRLRLRIRS